MKKSHQQDKPHHDKSLHKKQNLSLKMLESKSIYLVYNHKRTKKCYLLLTKFQMFQDFA